MPDPSPTAATVEVSILIVAYNDPQTLVDCIASIRDNTHGLSYEVLVIDNGDGSSASTAKSAFPWITIVPSEGNIGFGAGCNRLAACARSSRLLLLNPDTLMIGDTVTDIVNFSLRRPEAAAWGGMVMRPDGRPCSHNQMRLPTAGSLLREMAGGLFRRPKALLAADIVEREVDAIGGDFMLIDRRKFFDVGQFDESYFLYSEELDLCFRLRNGGETLLSTPSARLIHDVGHGQAASAGRLFYRQKGEAHYFWKHHSRLTVAIVLIMRWTSHVARYVGYFAIGKYSRRFAAFHAYRRLAVNPATWIFGYTSTGS